MNEEKSIIYIAYSDKQDSYSFISTINTVKAINATPVVLDMVKSTDLNYDSNNKLVDSTDDHGILLSKYASKIKEYSWHHSNVKEVVKDAKCIIFPGGTDISPTLCKVEQAWHGVNEDTDYSVERDVSDYILMKYALDNNIPLLAICRGMQLLSIVEGASIIGHLPNYFNDKGENENDLHRDHHKVDFVPHDVEVISKDSLFYKSVNKLNVSNLPSWHHQGVDNIEATPLTITGITRTNNIKIIEAVELKDKKFCLGVQFHPEVAVNKYLAKENDAVKFSDFETSISFFRLLKEAGEN